MRYLVAILFALILIIGCDKNELIMPVSMELQDSVSVPSFVIKAQSFGWEKVELHSTLSKFAFDSKGNIYFTNSGKLYFADQNFVIKDTLIIPTKKGYLNLYPDKIFINENDILFLAEYSGFNHLIFVSDDKGKTWSYPNGFNNTQISNFFSKGNRVYITSSGHDESSGMVQISEDNGNNWKAIINKGYGGSFSFCKENELNEIFFMGNGSLYYSGNYGITYLERKTNFERPWDNSLAFGISNELVVGNDSGIFITKDIGLSWQPIYKNPSPSEYFTLFNGANGLIYAMHEWSDDASDYRLKGVYVSNNGGYSWHSYLSKPDGNYYGVHQLGKDGYLYIVCRVNNVSSLYRSKVKL